jgi:type II secretion system protein D
VIEGDKVSLQFPNNPVADILAIYERLTNTTLIKDTSIFEGAEISLVTPRAVDKDEAVRLIEASLLTNGYAIVADPEGRSARILPARSQGASSAQFSQGVRFYTAAGDLPDGETIVTYFMRLDYMLPEEAAEILSGHVGLNSFGRITPVNTPPGLLLTESASIVKQLISIQQVIDASDTGSSLVTKFIPVRYADVATIAQVVQATLEAQAQERETKGINTIRGSVPAGGQRGGGDQGRSDAARAQAAAQQAQNRTVVIQQGAQAQFEAAPTAQIIADTRLNQILVVATPEDYTYIASLIAEFDKPLDIEAPYERVLKYAAAIDVLSALVDLLQDPVGGTIQLPGGGAIQQQRQQPLASSSSQLLTGRNTTNTRGGQVTSTSGATGAAGDTTTGSSALGSRPDVIEGPQEDNAPVSVLVNKTRLIADPMANSILVIGPQEDIEKVNVLLDKLDRKPAQVYLATVIGQLTLGEGVQSGFDYVAALSSPTDGTDFAASSITTRDEFLSSIIGGAIAPGAIGDLTNNAITTPFGPASGLNFYGAFGDSVEAFVTLLETTNRFKVLSRPSVFALNNKKAVITSGQLIPVPAQTISVPGVGGVAGSVTTTVEYRDVVLKLEVVPLINSEGEVILTISQVLDTVVATQRVEPNDVPIIGTEQLVTTVTVPNGRTVVLGGLISEETITDTRGVPVISQVPLLGRLFRNDVDSQERRELMIFIQPNVITDNTGLVGASLQEDLRSSVGEAAAERFPQRVDATTVPEPFLEEPEAKRKNFFQRLFSRKKKPNNSGAP